MKVKITKAFRDRLNKQLDYIARDKPGAARSFKTDIIRRIKEIPEMPFSYRKSIFFNKTDIRELIYKGYVIVFKVNQSNDTIEVFGFTRWEENPFDENK
jgi:plasmid stabilization system protein ParE